MGKLEFHKEIYLENTIILYWFVYEIINSSVLWPQQIMKKNYRIIWYNLEALKGNHGRLEAWKNIPFSSIKGMEIKLFLRSKVWVQFKAIVFNQLYLPSRSVNIFLPNSNQIVLKLSESNDPYQNRFGYRFKLLMLNSFVDWER